MVGGDFDGDGRSDYAAQLVIWKLGHTTTLDSAQLIVALLRRRDGFHREVVSVGGGPSFGVYLGRIPRGERVADFEGRSAVTLDHDAVSDLRRQGQRGARVRGRALARDPHRRLTTA